MKSGRSLWNELCVQYQQGVDTVGRMQHRWKGVKAKMDGERFEQVRMLLHIQEREAVWWRDACLLYFRAFSRMPLPRGLRTAGAYP